MLLRKLIRHKRLLVASSVGLAVACHAQPLLGQDREQTEQELRAVEAALEKKQRAKAALDKKTDVAETAAEEISQRLVTAAKNIRITEENATRLEVRIIDLETEADRMNQDLAARQSELLELLSALERLAKRPAALALLQPREALTTARSASLMGTIVPEISAKADLLKSDLNALASIQADLSRQRFNLKNTLERLTERQLKLGSLLEERKAEAASARNRAEATAREIRQFATEAQNLRELLEKLERSATSVAAVTRPSRPSEFRPDSRPIAEMKGALPQPAIGRVISRYGSQQTVGTARGIKIETRANAQVVAPYDGQVVFAGPFKAYGQLLIIEHGDGYYSLLAGLGIIHSLVGQWVLTGEPVGTMNASAEDRELYMEMRRGSQAFNPEPWLQKQVAQAQ